MQIKKGVEGNLLRTLINHYVGCSVKGWLFGSSPRHPQRREYRFSRKPFEPSLINTESGWFRIVPQQSGEVSLNHQGKRV